MMLNLAQRPRRLRKSDSLRRMVREVRLDIAQLIDVIFVSEKVSERREISSMPGVFQYSTSDAVEEARRIADLGIPALLLFGIPTDKDEQASQAYHDHGVVQRTVRAIKKALPDLVVITDVCLCEYMSHGHCGIVSDKANGTYEILNDESVDLIVKTALSQAAAGADIVAPSDMMDGRVGAIRAALD